MKKTIATVIIALSATFAHGATICSVTKESEKGTMTYDQVVYRGELEKDLILIKDGEEFKEIRSLSEVNWNALNNKEILTFLLQRERLSISVGKIDLAENAQNPFGLQTVGYGTLFQNSYMGIVAPDLGVSVSCMKY